MKVLYILGFARCGSTILGNLLGEIPGFVHIGELDRFWMRLSRTSLKCGCGDKLTECSVWSTVLERVRERFQEGGVVGSQTDRQQQWLDWVQELRAAALKERSAQSGHSTDHRPRLYKQLLEETFLQIKEVFAAKVIVDGSKAPASGLLLTDMPNIQPYFLHLIRDPRGAVLSRQKRKAQRTDGLYDLKLRSTVLDSLRWYHNNRAAEAIEKSGEGKYLRLRYESFITNPRESLLKIVSFVDEKPVESLAVENSTAWLRDNHTIGGNNNRFQSGEVKLKIDNTWVSSMRRRDCLVIAALTAPLLKRYEYALTRGYPQSQGGDA